MAKIPLFANWTWRLPLPKPFDSVAFSYSTTYWSKYCSTSTKKATLHASVLQAILSYMDMDTSLTPSAASENAIGTQGEKLIAEYQSRTGEIHVVVFNKKNGKFNVGRYEDISSNPRIYSLKDGSNTGSALFFALMPEALTDDEFREYYDILGKCKNDGYPDMDKAEQAAYILCDNLYRRIEGADLLTNAGIRISIPATGNLPQLTPLNLNKGAYSPSSVLFGTFRILTAPSAASGAVISMNKNDFQNHFKFSDRTFTPREELLIPALADWYIIPPEVVSICKHAQMTTNGNQPMRNFMLRGSAGTGKTEGAKAIAAGLGLPYMYYTCSANTEIYDFLGQMLPETNPSDTLHGDYPTLEDILMDPPSAYKKLTGIYEESISDSEVYEKLKEVMSADARLQSEQTSAGQRFCYVETPLITAIRNGYLIEIQEPTVIANPGVLVGLNALLDRCASITLVTGEVIHRHPDTVIVVTTNNNYAGCRDMNQSVISRMNLIIDMEDPDTDTLAERAMKVTGCTDKAAVAGMAETLRDINERCRETMVNDGSCGVRELISWVQSYMVCGSILDSAKYTVLSSVSSDPDNRADILSSCLEQKYAA